MGEYRKTFVNRIYTVGLTTCGSALVRIAGATESEGFQKVASFVNKWICGGNNTGQTLAEIQALCNEILNEVKIVDQHLKEYDAEIENTLQKIQYTEAKNELNQQCAVISGKVLEQQDLGTHTLFIAEVTDAKLLNENAPLTYADYQNRVKPKKKEIPQDKKIVGWRCKICNYVYEGSELPADYICPICGHDVSDFEPIFEN